MKIIRVGFSFDMFGGGVKYLGSFDDVGGVWLVACKSRYDPLPVALLVGLWWALSGRGSREVNVEVEGTCGHELRVMMILEQLGRL